MTTNKPDHAAALEHAEYILLVGIDVDKNLATCYLERDRQLKELRELARATILPLDKSLIQYEGDPQIKALRAALGEE